MTPLSFLRSDAVLRVISRAATAASAPVAVHYYREGEEGVRILGAGQCRACKAVAALETGSNACRRSRNAAGTTAVRRNVAMPFVCHMGFAGIVVRAFTYDTEGDDGYSLTIGPYCPRDG